MEVSAASRRATYDDLIAVPDHLAAEILDGELFTSPRPASPHVYATIALGCGLFGRFNGPPGGSDAPGGWWIRPDPELHLGPDVLVPDLAGWRREGMPVIPDVAAFTVAPDWVCEVVSPSTAPPRSHPEDADLRPRKRAAHVDHRSPDSHARGLPPGRRPLGGRRHAWRHDPVRAEPFAALCRSTCAGGGCRADGEPRPRAAVAAAPRSRAAPGSSSRARCRRCRSSAGAPRGDGHPGPGAARATSPATARRARCAGSCAIAATTRTGGGSGATADRRPTIVDGARASASTSCASGTGGRLSLVGWSLGGIYARELARRFPDDVRQVITLASPFRDLAATDGRAPLRAVGRGAAPPRRAVRDARLRDAAAGAVAPSIYSRSDGIVAWQSCLDDAGPRRENVEVRSSHCGMGHHPAALLVIADRLAQPEGSWRRIRRRAPAWSVAR